MSKIIEKRCSRCLKSKPTKFFRFKHRFLSRERIICEKCFDIEIAKKQAKKPVKKKPKKKKELSVSNEIKIKIDDLFKEQINIKREYNCFLYVFSCNEYYKVGITSDLKSRLAQLRCGSPYQIELEVAYPMVNSDEARIKERETHLKLTKEVFHERLEWFKRFDINIIENIVKRYTHG